MLYPLLLLPSNHLFCNFFVATPIFFFEKCPFFKFTLRPPITYFFQLLLFFCAYLPEFTWRFPSPLPPGILPILFPPPFRQCYVVVDLLVNLSLLPFFLFSLSSSKDWITGQIFAFLSLIFGDLYTFTNQLRFLLFFWHPPAATKRQIIFFPPSICLLLVLSSLCPHFPLNFRHSSLSPSLNIVV